MTAVLFGDVEDSIITWLQQELTIDVKDRVSKPRGQTFIIVERLGGPSLSVAHETATVTIESWAKDYRTANANAQLARQAVHSLAGRVVLGNAFSKIAEFAGPARLPDPVANTPRVVFTVSVTVRPV